MGPSLAAELGGSSSTARATADAKVCPPRPPTFTCPCMSNMSHGHVHVMCMCHISPTRSLRCELTSTCVFVLNVRRRRAPPSTPPPTAPPAAAYRRRPPPPAADRRRPPPPTAAAPGTAAGAARGVSRLDRRPGATSSGLGAAKWSQGVAGVWLRRLQMCVRRLDVNFCRSLSVCRLVAENSNR